MRGVDLRLDVEAHRAVAALLDERKDVGETGDALAVDRLLFGKRSGVLAARLDAADVVLPELLVGEVDDRRSRRIQEPARGVARMVGAEQAIVADRKSTRLNSSH